jgi:hypothetical protein
MKGDLSQKLFTGLLLDIWRSEKSGLLIIKEGKIEKKLVFQKGQMAVAKGLFSEERFLKFLQKNNLLDPPSVEPYESYSAKNKCSLLESFHQLSSLSPSRIWALLESFIIQDHLPLFDWSEGDYDFDDKQIPHLKDILFLIPILPFILQGVRQMENHHLLCAHLPGDEENLQCLSPDYMSQVKLNPPERYIWKLIKSSDNLGQLYETCVLGKRHTQKILFTLLSLGLISFSQEKMSEVSPPQHAQISLQKIWGSFNKKFSYIYKYISKELGPVAFNLMEKSLEETRPHLSSLLKEIKFDSGGRMVMDSNLKTSLTYANSETRMNLLRDLNEILISEILAVKKNLGHEHEAILINNLERIGEME